MEKKLKGQILGKRSSPRVSGGADDTGRERGWRKPRNSFEQVYRIGIEFREVLTRRDRGEIGGITFPAESSLFLSVPLRAVREAIDELKDFIGPLSPVCLHREITFQSGFPTAVRELLHAWQLTVGAPYVFIGRRGRNKWYGKAGRIYF